MIVNLRKTFLTNSTVQCLHLLSSVSQNRNFSLLWDLVACIKPKVRLKQTISMSHILQALTMVSKNPQKKLSLKSSLLIPFPVQKYKQTFEKNLTYIVHSNHSFQSLLTGNETKLTTIQGLFSLKTFQQFGIRNNLIKLDSFVGFIPFFVFWSILKLSFQAKCGFFLDRK